MAFQSGSQGGTAVNRIDLDGRRAVVTGGAQGIGRAIAERLLASGAAVALWDRDRSLVDATRAELAGQGQVHAVAVDVTDLAGVEAARDATNAALGGIDILVNNAGIAGPNHMLWEYPVEAWREVIEIDLNAVFYCCRAVVPQLIAQNYGRIVNVASIAGKEGNPSASAYAAAKAGVIALTKALGKELATYDIAVNCITPAAARTRIFDQITQEFVDFMLTKIPRGRFVTVEEIAAMVAWLVSAENSFTTGCGVRSVGRPRDLLTVSEWRSRAPARRRGSVIANPAGAGPADPLRGAGCGVRPAVRAILIVVPSVGGLAGPAARLRRAAPFVLVCIARFVLVWIWRARANITVMTKKDLPSRTDTGDDPVHAFLEEVAKTPPPKPGAGRARLIFAMDATASREPTWDRACQVQGQMFLETAALGGLDVQLVYYRGFDECRASRWVNNPSDLVRLMTGVFCLAGQTKIGRVLQHAVRETQKKRVAVAGVRRRLLRGEPRRGRPDARASSACSGCARSCSRRATILQAERAFRHIAKLTNGAALQVRFEQPAAAARSPRRGRRLRRRRTAGARRPVQALQPGGAAAGQPGQVSGWPSTSCSAPSCSASGCWRRAASSRPIRRTSPRACGRSSPRSARSPARACCSPAASASP